MTVQKALQDIEKKWDELLEITGYWFDENRNIMRRIGPPKKKRDYLRDIRFKSIDDLDDSAACLCAIYKVFNKKSRLNPYLFFIAWIRHKYKKIADEIISHLDEIDAGFWDLQGADQIDFRIDQYEKKVIKAVKTLSLLKRTMSSEGWKSKVYQKAVAMGYQSAIKKEEKKIETFQRCVEKKKESDGTVSLRNIQRCLNLTAIEKSGRDEIEVLNKFGGLNTLRIIQFLEGMVKRGFLYAETEICKGKKINYISDSFQEKRRNPAWSHPLLSKKQFSL
jgi:hypothetical protein